MGAYSKATDSGSPVWTVAPDEVSAPGNPYRVGTVTLTGGNGRAYRSIEFDAATAETDAGEIGELTGFSVSAVIEAGQCGVFIGSVRTFEADFANQRFISRECTAAGVPDDSTIEILGTTKPKAGDRIELRIAWSELTETWRFQFIVNAVPLDVFPEAVDFSGTAHTVGLIGAAGAKWNHFLIDCSVTLSSQRFCFEVEAGQQFTTPISWMPTYPTGYGWAGNQATPPTGTPFPPPGWAPHTNLLTAKSFGIVIPDEATSWTVNPAIRYGFIRGGPNTVIRWKGYNGGTLLPSGPIVTNDVWTGLPVFGGQTTFGPRDLFPLGMTLFSPGMTDQEKRAYVQTPDFGFGIYWQASPDVAASPSMRTILHTVYRMYLTVCYTIDL